MIFFRHLIVVASDINPYQPKVFEVKFRLREIGKILFTKISNFKLWKIPKVLNLRFPEG